MKQFDLTSMKSTCSLRHNRMWNVGDSLLVQESIEGAFDLYVVCTIHLKIFTVRAVDTALLLRRILIQLFKWSWSESSDKVYVNCCVSWCDGLPHVFNCVIMVWFVGHVLNYSFDHDMNCLADVFVRSWSESFESFIWEINFIFTCSYICWSMIWIAV
jgi:hypothetical protein